MQIVQNLIQNSLILRSIWMPIVRVYDCESKIRILIDVSGLGKHEGIYVNESLNEIFFEIYLIAHFNLNDKTDGCILSIFDRTIIILELLNDFNLGFSNHEFTFLLF